MVDTRDLKSLALMSMRVRLPPVLPTTEHREHYEKPVMIEEITKLNDLEVFVYTCKGELINIKSRWKQNDKQNRYVGESGGAIDATVPENDTQD